MKKITDTRQPLTPRFRRSGTGSAQAVKLLPARSSTRARNGLIFVITRTASQASTRESGHGDSKTAY